MLWLTLVLLDSLQLSRSMYSERTISVVFIVSQSSDPVQCY